MPRLPPFIRRVILRTILLAIPVCAGWFAWTAWLKPWLFPPSPLVLTPQLVLEKLEAKSLYFNGIAAPWLAANRQDLLTAEDKDPASARHRGFIQAPQSPKLFRQLDRQYRFDTLLLVGDPSNYQRLVDHLLEPEPDKRDFRLVYLDHWALVFKRGAEREWEPADADALKERMRTLRSEDRALFFAKAASKMLALRKVGPAKSWLDEALQADGNSVETLATLARYHMTLGKWKEAESFADKALELDENSISALAVKVVTMRATDHKIDALKLSVKLNALLPEDPMRLWQHAQIAHEANDYGQEITALTRLIALAEEDERPAGDYHFRLGEAHVFMAMTDATHTAGAVEHLKKALLDPALPPEKRKFAEERLATIRTRTGLK